MSRASVSQPIARAPIPTTPSGIRGFAARIPSTPDGKERGRRGRPLQPRHPATNASGWLLVTVAAVCALRPWNHQRHPVTDLPIPNRAEPVHGSQSRYSMSTACSISGSLVRLPYGSHRISNEGSHHIATSFHKRYRAFHTMQGRFAFLAFGVCSRTMGLCIARLPLRSDIVLLA